ncbi:MAG: flagellar export protein FliJ [Candidatus Aureabacteria bacterium]|nr:flagellar export protein FliJ [Candidatus Auribacterota bacterium]
MKRFKFKLEPVLWHRKHMEDIKKKELAEVFRELKDAQDFLSSLDRDFKKTQISIQREESIKIIDIEKVLLFEAYMIYLKRLMEQTQIRIGEIEKKLDKKRKEYIKATKAKRVIERLKEKQYFVYMKDMEIKEQKFIDEMGLVRHMRISGKR